MPELPEVETVRRGLAPVMEGRRFTRVEQRRPDLRFPFPERFAARLEGRRLLRLDRRAKYLVGHVEGGEALVMHLGMSGRFAIGQPDKAGGRLGQFTHNQGGAAAHDHVVFTMGGGATITYHDARRFGFMLLIEAARLAEHKLFANIGIEPLGPELTPEFLAASAHGRRADLKAFLMDQTVVCGLGNIYVCEALFRARLDPRKPAARLALRSGKPTDAARRQVPVIRAVLDEAIAAGGSTLRDFAQADGSLGYFQHRFQAYGREAEPCVTAGCGATIRRIVQANRSTYLCPRCQR